MMFMSESIMLDTQLNDGSDPNDSLLGKLWNAGKRAMIGESFFLTHYTGTSNLPGPVAFSGPYPGKIIAVDLNSCNDQVLCQRRAFLAAAYGTKIDLAFTRNLDACFLGGEGFILQRLVGDGMAFIHSCGKTVEIHLKNQTLRVNPGCIVGFEESINYDIQVAGNLITMIFGTKSIFLATLKGTGKVWLQSLPFNLLANRIIDEGKKQGLFANKREGGHWGSFN